MTKRADVLKNLKKVAKARGVEMTTEEGGDHTKVFFDGHKVTVLGRHNEIENRLADKIVKQADTFELPVVEEE